MANEVEQGADAERAVDEALAHIAHLCDQIGPRPVGSDGDVAAARYVQKEMLSIHTADVLRQDFRAPTSVWLPFVVAIATALLGIGLWALTGGSTLGSYLGALGCGFALWEVYAEMNFGWSPLSGLLRRRETQNVVSTIAPSEAEGRNAIIFAHLDTQRTPIWQRSRAGLLLWLVGFYLLVVVLTVTLVALIVSWFVGFALPLWAGIPLVVVSVPALLVLLHAQFTPYTVGANDNASSVGVALALARRFAAAPLRNTRLWVVFTGAEETGCHGAAAFIEEYGDRLIQGYVLALEGVGVEKPGYSVREGMLGVYRSNTELIRIAERLAKADQSLGLKPLRLRGGYTETGLASRRGMRSMGITGLDSQGLMPYWHTLERHP